MTSNPEFPSEKRGEEWRPVSPDNVENLIDILVAAGVSVDAWGQDSAKTVEHLLVEIQKGESQIGVGSNGEMRRRVKSVGVDVYCTAPDGNVYVLREDRQEYKSKIEGEAVRVKRRKLSTSLGEKMGSSEEPDDAAVRALTEEVKGSEIIGLYPMGIHKKVGPSESYPGLIGDNTIALYATVLSTASFNPGEHIEDQDDKTNYYVWDLLFAVENKPA